MLSATFLAPFLIPMFYYLVMEKIFKPKAKPAAPAPVPQPEPPNPEPGEGSAAA
jgi:hypothetical protein